MLKILQIKPDKYTSAEIVNIDDFVGLSREVWLNNHKLPSNLLPMTVVTDRNPPDIFSSGPWYFYSKRLKELIEKYDTKEKIEFRASEVTRKNGKAVGEYFLANVCHQVDCFNAEKSICTERNGLYIDLKELTLREEKIQDSDLIFKVRNLPSSEVFVNGQLCEALMSSNLNGLWLMDIAELNEYKSIGRNPKSRG